ncbi:MAG: 3-dehydroquinate synthase [Chitinophagaceae bacterium]
MRKQLRFSNGATTVLYFASAFKHLNSIVAKKSAVIITDEHVFALHQPKFKGYHCIVLKSGEVFKTQQTVDSVIQQLITIQADKTYTLVGVGGGVVTDITGYVASIYMRGIAFGFVPTTLLAMVDASIGGKNGVDVGHYKNMIGTTRQPHFILYDTTFLKTLPQAEWFNGFAEIIKHAAIKDAAMFKQLQQYDIAYYQKHRTHLQLLIQRNALLKGKVVVNDPFEQGDRKLLNFGHTLGHALENQYQISHGEAISVGMCFAVYASQCYANFKQADAVVALLSQYQLPTQLSFDPKSAFEILKMDKKRASSDMRYILLQRIGKAYIQTIPLKDIVGLLYSYKQFN